MEIPALADLLDVQELDLEIDRLLHRRSTLPELERYRATQEQLNALDEQIEAAQAELRQIELDTDKAEGELEMLEEKLQQHETRLFAGGMSGRETEHMRLEVQGLRGQKGASEERVLGLLEKLDPAREDLSNLEAQRQMLAGEKAELEGFITEEWRKIDSELARKEERKREAVAPVPEDLVELYEKLRSTKEGVGVGRLDNDTCGGCHMRLSPAEVAEVKKADPPRCVHCRRILVI
ncbi:MAG TPA: C4-type zinc ribbon domain-containing protein [Acidimicrobiia bacterium]|nr:C4-type zinc ribbon domain-containing protein [Acidimicrobiia bacterium]